MKKVLIAFGTRPEAIKLAPVIRQLNIQSSKFKTIICVTAQHREMLDQVLILFEIVPDYDLNIMLENQDLFDVTINSLDKLKTILKEEHPDIVLVQGDTTTTFTVSLAAFYLKIPIAHVEAGLRTYSKYQPFPEEINRHITTILADYHFAPTEWARQNLINEGISSDKIWVTGNTSIDTLQIVSKKQRADSNKNNWIINFNEKYGVPELSDSHKIILVTAHRRENFGEGFKNICLALREIAQRNPDVAIIYPVHPNPNIRKSAFDMLALNGKISSTPQNIYLIEPVDYNTFVYLMDISYLILTDSGGIQEEAPSLGKPVLVMRDTTERPEGVEAGVSKLIGTNIGKIVSEAQKLLDDKVAYQSMSSIKNPFGDGDAALRIVEIIATH